MRTRKEIEDEVKEMYSGVRLPSGTSIQLTQLEVLLDIRDSLINQ